MRLLSFSTDYAGPAIVTPGSMGQWLERALRDMKCSVLQSRGYGFETWSGQIWDAYSF